MNYQLILTRVLLAVAIAVISVFLGILFKGIDRKIAAKMQSRIGPPLLQPWWDIQKLLSKENIVPENAVPWLFNGAPLLALAVTISILFYLPIGGITPVAEGTGDLILILYLLMFPAVLMVIGGFASGSPYAAVGAQREMVMMMSYEFPLATVVMAIAWKLTAAYGPVLDAFGLQPFSLVTLAVFPVWGIVGVVGAVGMLVLLGVMLVVTPAELAKVPFDAPEAHEEISAGFLVEYSGRNMALFYLMDAVKTVVVASLLVAIFFPYGVTGLLSLLVPNVHYLPNYLIFAAEFIFFWLKVLAVMVAAVTFVRVAIARLKIDQIAHVFWAPVLATGLVGLALVVVDHFFFF